MDKIVFDFEEDISEVRVAKLDILIKKIADAKPESKQTMASVFRCYLRDWGESDDLQ